MSDEVRQHCLEPFFTTKEKGRMGLGLAMVHGIIQRHDGRIDIESQPGRGTTVSIRLPLEKAANAQARTAAETFERSLHVLVVDDQPVLCEILSTYLQD